ncbi:BDN_1c_G0025470.mRNA.1.CDS.1 [Saccharomyces cerevisiae]|nr:BDN_1c_G0025470.mRNA.1.CDS.1 [Saccharomyces cerevisiae]CAI7121696.1 BDN_1c_G0025470.mRNA.1.CDS.1 [Saccharomyces cerevisiae]
MHWITLVAFIATFFNLAATSINNRVLPDVDLTNPLRFFTNIPAGLNFNEVIFLERNGFYLGGIDSPSIYHLINGTAVYFGDVRDNIMPGTVGTTRNVTDVDYGSLLTEYGYEANTDYVSRWIATHVVISPLNATELFPNTRASTSASADNNTAPTGELKTTLVRTRSTR